MVLVYHCPNYGRSHRGVGNLSGPTWCADRMARTGVRRVHPGARSCQGTGRTLARLQLDGLLGRGFVCALYDAYGSADGTRQAAACVGLRGVKHHCARRSRRRLLKHGSRRGGRNIPACRETGEATAPYAHDASGEYSLRPFNDGLSLLEATNKPKEPS
jgi:hypothetical protein